MFGTSMLGTIRGRTGAHSEPKVLIVSRCAGPAVSVVVLLAGGRAGGSDYQA